MAIISSRNLGKTYGKKTSAFIALDSINIDIESGESIAITGKSGSGKSTLMHILALLDTPTTGTITFEGRDINDLRSWEINTLRNEKFGFVFQQFFMNSRDSVLNNVMLPLTIAGVDHRERKQRALDALATVDLLDKAKSRASDLSGGQKQRVCVARALVNNPTVIFADEPTGNLDSATGQKIVDLLLKLNREKGITLIVVTHDPDLARRCKRRIRIKDGQVVERPKRTRGSKRKSATTTKSSTQKITVTGGKK